MVIDFGDISQMLTKKIHDVLDHGWIVYIGDAEMCKVMQVNTADLTDKVGVMRNPLGWKIIPFPYTPTAENIAKWAFEELVHSIDNMSTADHVVWLHAIDVYETPKSVASFTRDEIKP
jgi:6-pyruvoyl-tetrahydropterin synthase